MIYYFILFLSDILCMVYVPFSISMISQSEINYYYYYNVAVAVCTYHIMDLQSSYAVDPNKSASRGIVQR